MHRNTTQCGVKEEEEESVRLNKIKKIKKYAIKAGIL